MRVCLLLFLISIAMSGSYRLNATVLNMQPSNGTVRSTACDNIERHSSTVIFLFNIPSQSFLNMPRIHEQLQNMETNGNWFESIIKVTHLTPRYNISPISLHMIRGYGRPG